MRITGRLGRGALFQNKADIALLCEWSGVELYFDKGFRLKNRLPQKNWLCKKLLK
jgi:hypothetical protein